MKRKKSIKYCFFTLLVLAFLVACGQLKNIVEKPENAKHEKTSKNITEKNKEKRMKESDQTKNVSEIDHNLAIKTAQKYLSYNDKQAVDTITNFQDP